MCFQGPGDDMGARSRAARQGGTARSWAGCGLQGWSTFPPRTQASQSQAQALPLPGEEARWGGRWFAVFSCKALGWQLL